MTARFSLFRWVVCGLLLSACGGRADPGLDDPDCLEAGECVCRVSDECPGGFDCIDGRCQRPQSVTGTRPFAALCEADRECASGRCLAAGDGGHRRCTDACGAGDDCPEGWACRTDPDSASAGVCVQAEFRLCGPCDQDRDCGPAGTARCLAGRCAEDCSRENCPLGYTCQDPGDGLRQCAPAAGACGCTRVGLSIACAQTNGFGTCWGRRLCDFGGFSECDAPTPSAEVCNGVDDDCDGLIDDEDPDIDLTGLPAEYPACQIGEADNCRGRWVCAETRWQCDVIAPASETCDGLDNDCDGVIDQPYVDSVGRYLTAAHCGGCNRNCGDLLDDLRSQADGSVDPAAAACEDRGGEATCVPVACRPGFSPYPEDAPIACVPVASVQCLACVENADCLFEANRCVQIGEDLNAACVQGCDVDAPIPGCTGEVGIQGCCPNGSRCESRQGALVCIPDGAGCDCRAERLAATRPCQRPGDGGAQCAGIQTCEAGPTGPAWSSCDAAEVTREVCNGLDDDCDGTVDNGFFDTRGTGTYDTDAHCGQCFQSCLALPNAVGECAAGAECAIAACTPGRIGGGGLCLSDADCTDNFTCDPVIHQCTRRCGSGCEAGQACVDGFCAPRCTTDSSCARLGVGATCQSGACGVSYDYVDRDDAVANGCECPVWAGGGPDVPDLYPTLPVAGAAYVDRDCDGVDGVASRSLFVRAGAVGGSGQRERPFGTISDALTAFDSSRFDTILVAGGLYDEAITLPNGVGLHGGYSDDFLDRDVTGRPSILAPARPNDEPAAAVVTVPAGVTATLAGFVIQAWDAVSGPSAGRDGGSSIGVLLQQPGPDVVVQNNEIRAGRGGDGAPGIAGQAGGDGSDGGDGQAARECVSLDCANEVSVGGAGGTNGRCTGAAGRAGGRSAGGVDPQQYQAPLGLNGRGGDNAIYANFNNPDFEDLCKYDCAVPGDQVGQPAASGPNGGDGQGGAGCSRSAGSLLGGIWSPVAALGGGRGSNGQGGGGGGAGGNVVNLNPPTCRIGNRVGDLGSTGGGGGAGGCGGTSGGRGGGGGASIAILVVDAILGGPTIAGNRLVNGRGGDGGPGGAGGAGGVGGQGGDGGVAVSPAWCAGDAGKGGRGGDGGAGGGGGGGCGGPSFGIAGRGLNATDLQRNNEFGPSGLGGAGGAGGATPGSRVAGDGAQGDADAVHVFP